VQPNSYDCGFYMLHFAQMIMKDPAKYREIMQVMYLLRFTIPFVLLDNYSSLVQVQI
jgi:Ulp1 family protease